MRYALAVAIGIAGAVLLSRRPAIHGPGEQPQLPPGEFAQFPAEAEPQFPEPPEPFEEMSVSVTEFVKNTVAGALAVFGTKYDALIHQSALQAGIDPAVLYRLLYRESHFRDDIITGKVKSRVGALGIAQFMPATAREWLGSETAALDPRLAIPGAARYLAWLIRQFGGNVMQAVAAYNWGIGNVKKKGLAAAPAETRAYVSAITGETIA